MILFENFQSLVFDVDEKINFPIFYEIMNNSKLAR